MESTLLVKNFKALPHRYSIVYWDYILCKSGINFVTNWHN